MNPLGQQVILAFTNWTNHIWLAFPKFINAVSPIHTFVCLLTESWTFSVFTEEEEEELKRRNPLQNTDLMGWYYWSGEAWETALSSWICV